MLQGSRAVQAALHDRPPECCQICVVYPCPHSVGMRAALRMMMYLSCMVIGAMLVMTLFRPSVIDVVAMFLQTYSGRLVASGLAIILLLSPLAILLRWWQVMRRAREISYQTENGRISVSLQAIEEAFDARPGRGAGSQKGAYAGVLEAIGSSARSSSKR